MLDSCLPIAVCIRIIITIFLKSFILNRITLYFETRYLLKNSHLDTLNPLDVGPSKTSNKYLENFMKIYHCLLNKCYTFPSKINTHLCIRTHDEHPHTHTFSNSNYIKIHITSNISKRMRSSSTGSENAQNEYKEE